jgi:hypothetical protein
MIDKKAYRGATIQRWVVIILERQQRFSQGACENMIQGLRQSAEAMGMPPNYFLSFIVCQFYSFAGIQGFQSQPLVSWENAQADIIQVYT